MSEVGFSQRQFDALMEKAFPNKKSTWEYWKDKLILPLALTLGGTLLTLLVGHVQEAQNQKNFENSMTLTKIQSRDKYLAYFQQNSSLTQRIPAVSSLIDLGATDLAADLVVFGIGEFPDDGRQQDQVNYFVETTGTSLIPRLCFLASYSDTPYVAFELGDGFHPSDYKPEAADIALDYAVRLAHHQHEQVAIRDLAFSVPGKDETFAQGQIRDGAVVVLSELIRGEQRRQKQDFDWNVLFDPLKAVLASERSSSAKVAALSALATRSREGEMTEIFQNKHLDDNLRNYARVALYKDGKASDATSAVIAAAFQDRSTPFGVRCEIAAAEPHKFSQPLLDLLHSNEESDRYFVAKCLQRFHSPIDTQILIEAYRNERVSEVKESLLSVLEDGRPDAPTLKTLIAATLDHDQVVRAAAYQALDDIDEDAASAVLLRGLTDNDPGVVNTVVYLLTNHDDSTRHEAERRVGAMPASDLRDKWLDRLKQADFARERARRNATNAK
jgi:HEAT repeat protein